MNSLGNLVDMILGEIVEREKADVNRQTVPAEVSVECSGGGYQLAKMCFTLGFDLFECEKFLVDFGVDVKKFPTAKDNGGTQFVNGFGNSAEFVVLLVELFLKFFEFSCFLFMKKESVCVCYKCGMMVYLLLVRSL